MCRLDSSPLGGPVSTYDWLGSYERAEAEQDMSKLHQCVLEIEKALFIRMQELSADPTAEAQTEMQEIHAAVRALLRIKTERLKWPGLDLSELQNDSSN
jgi:hypothetical protein